MNGTSFLDTYFLASQAGGELVYSTKFNNNTFIESLASKYNKKDNEAFVNELNEYFLDYDDYEYLIDSIYTDLVNKSNGNSFVSLHYKFKSINDTTGEENHYW